MRAIKIKENIYWVGAIDWDLRNFHGYLTKRGSSYNAYLIIDEKITLIDTVKSTFCGEMMERITSIVDPAKIDYIISNHTEMDHSGALPCLLKIAKNAKIFASPNGERGLKKHYSFDRDITIVKSGDSLSLGKYTLNFQLAQMVHWPDSMVSYLVEEEILFSNDAFGQHIATHERFNDELNQGMVDEETAKYYANIVLSYGNQVTKLLDALKDVSVSIIAPSHGVIFRNNISELIKKYLYWAKNEHREKAIILYDTMWKSTEKMAYIIRDLFEENQITYELHNLSVDHISDVMTTLLDAKYVFVGSSTLNNNILPTVAAFLTYMKGLAPKNRIGIAFGSYGWSGESIKQIEDILESANFKVPIKNLKIQYVPSFSDLTDFKEKISQAIFNKKSDVVYEVEKVCN